MRAFRGRLRDTTVLCPVADLKNACDLSGLVSEQAPLLDARPDDETPSAADGHNELMIVRR